MSGMLKAVVEATNNVAKPILKDNECYGVFRKHLFKGLSICFVNKDKKRCELELKYLTNLNKGKYKFVIMPMTYLISPENYILIVNGEYRYQK